MKNMMMIGLVFLGMNSAFAVSMKQDLAITLGLGSGDTHNKAAEEACKAECLGMVEKAKATNPAFGSYENLTCEVRNVGPTVECVLTGTQRL